VKIEPMPKEYVITVNQDDLDQLILALEYAFDYVDLWGENRTDPRPDTRFATLKHQLEVAG
jgi:hypothetical protein